MARGSRLIAGHSMPLCHFPVSLMAFVGLMANELDYQLILIFPSSLQVTTLARDEAFISTSFEILLKNRNILQFTHIYSIKFLIRMSLSRLCVQEGHCGKRRRISKLFCVCALMFHGLCRGKKQDAPGGCVAGIAACVQEENDNVLRAITV